MIFMKFDEKYAHSYCCAVLELLLNSIKLKPKTVFTHTHTTHRM